MQEDIWRKKNAAFRSGLTLVELVMAAMISTIIILITGIVLVAGQRNWNDTFNEANSGIRVDAVDTMITFGIVGRQSNKSDYRIYKEAGGAFIRAVPPASQPVSVVTGEAVEFRYWDTELNASFIDNAKTATAYALFYLEGDTLKVDRGPYPPGGVNANTLTRNGGLGVSTTILARNVVDVNFSHTTKNVAGDGDGCVKMDLTLRDPIKKDVLTVKTATLMRNVWP
jgi:hypothetical protein